MFSVTGSVRIWDIKATREVFVQKDSVVSPAQDGGLAVVQLILNKTTGSFAVVSADHNIVIHGLDDFKRRKLVSF